MRASRELEEVNTYTHRTVWVPNPRVFLKIVTVMHHGGDWKGPTDPKDLAYRGKTLMRQRIRARFMSIGQPVLIQIVEGIWRA